MLQRPFFSTAAGILTATLLWSSAPIALAADWLYTFRAGDTLWDVCKQYTRHRNCWQELGPYNNIALNRQIPPGTRIKIPAKWLKIPAASADVAFVSGEVWVALYEEAPKPAEPGVKLPIGAKVITAEGSASILFADGSTITLEPHSEMALDTLSNFEQHGMVDSTVRLNRGTIKTRVIERDPRSRFQTITPSAVASVRGTEYRVNLEEIADSGDSEKAQAITRISVYQGLVDVGAEQEIYPVPAEFGILAKQGETLAPPVKLLPAPEFIPFERQQYRLFKPDGSLAKPVTLSWKALPNARSYQLNVFALPEDKSASEQLLKVQLVSTTKSTLTDLSDRCYLLVLRAVDTLGLHGLASKEQLCLKPQLPAPVFSPEETSIQGGQQLALQWSAIDGAESYALEVAEQEDFTHVLEKIHTSETAMMLRYEEPVFVRIRALGAEGADSEYSQTLSWQPDAPEQSYWDFLYPIGLYLIGLILI